MVNSIPLILVDRNGVGHDPRLAAAADNAVAFSIFLGFLIACLTRA